MSETEKAPEAVAPPPAQTEAEKKSGPVSFVMIAIFHITFIHRE